MTNILCTQCSTPVDIVPDFPWEDDIISEVTCGSRCKAILLELDYLAEFATTEEPF